MMAKKRERREGSSREGMLDGCKLMDETERGWKSSKATSCLEGGGGDDIDFTYKKCIRVSHDAGQKGISGYSTVHRKREVNRVISHFTMSTS